jgi:hypothetical protein
MDATPSLRRIGNAGNRAAYIASLQKKLASGQLSEPERIRQAEAHMAAGRQEARDQLLGRTPAPHPVERTTVFQMLASAGEQRAGAVRVRAEARAWGAQAAAREARRQALVEATTGGEIGAHQRALDKIGRVAG